MPHRRLRTGGLFINNVSMHISMSMSTMYQCISACLLKHVVRATTRRRCRAQMVTKDRTVREAIRVVQSMRSELITVGP